MLKWHVRQKERRLIAAQPDIRRTLIFAQKFRHPFCLQAITRRNNGHIRKAPHQRNVFKHLVRGAVGSNREPGMRANNNDRLIVKTNCRANLLPVTPRAKGRIACRKRMFARTRQTACHRYEILLGHPNLNVSLRKSFLKQ